MRHTAATISAGESPLLMIATRNAADAEAERKRPVTHVLLFSPTTPAQWVMPCCVRWAAGVKKDKQETQKKKRKCMRHLPPPLSG